MTRRWWIKQGRCPACQRRILKVKFDRERRGRPAVAEPGILSGPLERMGRPAGRRLFGLGRVDARVLEPGDFPWSDEYLLRPHTCDEGRDEARRRWDVRRARERDPVPT